jgi:hypothetical protein
MEKNTKIYHCDICNKTYATYNTLWTHNKKFHTKKPGKEYICKHCNKSYDNKQTKYYHQKYCKIRKPEEKINTLPANIQKPEEKSNIIKHTSVKSTKNNICCANLINNQLIDTILNKNKLIEQLYNTHFDTKIMEEVKKETIENPEMLSNNQIIINDVTIICRSKDNYVNGYQICKAGNKNFNDWINLETTKDIINELENTIGISSLYLIENKKDNMLDLNQEVWLHPDLAISLAYWISSKFALQISKWIRNLFSNVDINIKAIKDQQNELDKKDQRIKLLQDMYLKKQSRSQYPQKNVIYIVTTEENKKKGIYILGKAKVLKNRLSTYNKTAEHKVIYYKECKNEEDMAAIEMVVLTKLKNYREKANRDRFILPIDKDISLFTSIIDNAVNYFYNNINNESDLDM